MAMASRKHSSMATSVTWHTIAGSTPPTQQGRADDQAALSSTKSEQRQTKIIKQEAESVGPRTTSAPPSQLQVTNILGDCILRATDASRQTLSSLESVILNSYANCSILDVQHVSHKPWSDTANFSCSQQMLCSLILFSFPQATSFLK